ncbi:MAG TPA: hydroxymethylglutaryl-CoA lyase, partial [Propionibacteriaceae bacterium]|nr:hydroxymethylglutaryl-CoA lyase [Propionibacteriaceae bacterium]
MDRLPAVHRRLGLPAVVTVYEVGPRDGLQAEKTVVPLEVKLELIDRLGQAGLRVIETTSFVSARGVPQLADADELMAGRRRR